VKLYLCNWNRICGSHIFLQRLTLFYRNPCAGVNRICGYLMAKPLAWSVCCVLSLHCLLAAIPFGIFSSHWQIWLQV